MKTCRQILNFLRNRPRWVLQYHSKLKIRADGPCWLLRSSRCGKTTVPCGTRGAKAAARHLALSFTALDGTLTYELEK